MGKSEKCTKFDTLIYAIFIAAKIDFGGYFKFTLYIKNCQYSINLTYAPLIFMYFTTIILYVIMLNVNKLYIRILSRDVNCCNVKNGFLQDDQNIELSEGGFILCLKH